MPVPKPSVCSLSQRAWGSIEACERVLTPSHLQSIVALLQSRESFRETSVGLVLCRALRRETRRSEWVLSA